MSDTISLKKLSHVLTKLKAALGSTASYTYSVSANDPRAENKIMAAASEFKLARAKFQRMNTAYYEMRKLVSDANSRSGVSSLLAEIALNQDEHDSIQPLTRGGYDPGVVREIIERAMARLSQATGYGGHSDRVEGTVISDAEAAEYAKELIRLKRVISALQDRVQELNYSTKVEITDIHVSVLQEIGAV